MEAVSLTGLCLASPPRPTPVHLQGKMSLLKANRANKRMVDIAWTRAGHVPFFKKRGFQPAAVSAMLSDAGARVASKLAKFAPPGQKRSILPRMTRGAKRSSLRLVAYVAMMPRAVALHWLPSPCSSPGCGTA